MDIAKIEKLPRKFSGNAMPLQPESNHDDPNRLTLDRQLCFGLYAASHAMTKAYRPMLGKLGLTYPQYLVLMALWERNGQTVSELGAVLMLDSGTLSPLLKRLEAAGLIRKLRLQTDERQVEISLTSHGLNLREASGRIREKIVCLLGINDADIAAMREKLNGLIVALNQHSQFRLKSAAE